MATIFTKPVNEISADDVLELVREQQPETDTVEFKESLPSRNGRDTWYSGASQISDYARNQLLAEVVAFANAHGGYLLIGIKETEDNPHRASDILPIPRCLDLAERLKLQIRDCIEPTIPMVNVKGISTASNGDGVVLIGLPQSRMAPHRLKANDKCFYRHADRTETMSMRDIQDITIQRMNMGSQLDEKFASRRTAFNSWITNMRPDAGDRVGCRITLIPTSATYANNLFRNYALVSGLNKFKVEFESDTWLDAFLPTSLTYERPILRGTRRSDAVRDPQIIQEAYNDGVLEICFRNTERDAKIFITWIVGVLCNGLLMADTFRRNLGAPDVEYAFELEVASTIPITYYARGFTDRLGEPLNGPVIYPRMALAELNSTAFAQLVEIVLGDIWNSCGLAFSERVRLISWA